MGFSFHVIRALLSFKLWSFSPKNFSSCDYWKNEPWIHRSRSLLTLQWTPPFIKTEWNQFCQLRVKDSTEKKVGACINAKIRTEICGTHWALFIPFNVPNGTVNYTSRLTDPTQATARLVIFLVSRTRMKWVKDKLVKDKL